MLGIFDFPEIVGKLAFFGNWLRGRPSASFFNVRQDVVVGVGDGVKDSAQFAQRVVRGGTSEFDDLGGELFSFGEAPSSRLEKPEKQELGVERRSFGIESNAQVPTAVIDVHVVVRLAPRHILSEATKSFRQVSKRHVGLDPLVFTHGQQK